MISALNTLNCFNYFRQIASRKNWEIAIPDVVVVELSKYSKFQTIQEKFPIRIFEIPKDNINRMRNRYPALNDGELAVLFLTLNYRDFLKSATAAFAILDDRASRNVAKKLGIDYFGTLRLLHEMLKEKIITKSKFLECTAKLRETGFYFKECILREITNNI